MEIKKSYEIFVPGVGTISFGGGGQSILLDVMPDLLLTASKLTELREAIDKALELIGEPISEEEEAVPEQKDEWLAGDPEPTDVTTVWDRDHDCWNLTPSMGWWFYGEMKLSLSWEELVDTYGPLRREA